MQNYSTENDAEEGLQLNQQYGDTQLQTWERASGGDVSQGEDGEMQGLM